MIIPVKLKTENYDIVLERGAIQRVGELIDLDRKVFIVTDSGVPKEYAETVANQCKLSHIETVPQGETGKSLETLQRLFSKMLEFDMGRDDLLVAVGGGVVGDISGLAASLYMRGVDFINIPTTLLSQVDSSVGGKTAVNFERVKNLVGTFYQPKKVIIDADTLRTLPTRMIHEGLAEVIKMALIGDGKLFEYIENSVKDIKAKDIDIDELETIIERTLRIKINIVEQDEKDAGLRHVLNFGHTIGHAIESANEGKLLHGECVALGMLPMCSDNVRKRLTDVLKKYDLPLEIKEDFETLKSAMLHDKKKAHDGISCVLVDEVGHYEIKKLSIEEIGKRYEIRSHW